MPIKILSRHETPWIAKDARYIYKEKQNNVQQDALTCSFVNRRVLNRAEHDMMETSEAHKGKRRRVLANGWGALALIVQQMDLLVSLAMNSDGNAFDFELRGDGKLIKIEEHELGQYYDWLAPLIRAAFDDELGLYRFRLPPHAEVFHDVVKRHEAKMPILSDCFSKWPTFYETDLLRFCGELANDVFALICREAHARDPNKGISARKADGKRAYKRMLAFKQECFAKRKELLLMVIEFAYHPEAAAQMPLAQAKRDHATFVNRLRGNVKSVAAAIGGIWTLAWGERKGHHFRWIFMLDASLVQDSTEWTEFAGNAWKSVVGDGEGYVRLPGPDDPASAVVGRIDANDAVRMKVLDDEIEYVAYRDNLIQLKETEGVRSWGTWVPANTRKDRRRKQSV
ncbi:hypothetical protein X976_1863 [Burkholderia pseudomallei MSHR7500]|nr:hypothetical protein X976_1863 [Burkholderia pseudomallei MSHR7500]